MTPGDLRLGSRLDALRHIAAFAGGACAVIGSVSQASAYGFGVSRAAFSHPDIAWNGVLISLAAAFCGAVGSVAFFSRLLAGVLLFGSALASFVGATWFASYTLPAIVRSGVAGQVSGPLDMSWLLTIACPLFLLAGGLALRRRLVR